MYKLQWEAERSLSKSSQTVCSRFAHNLQAAAAHFDQQVKRKMDPSKGLRLALVLCLDPSFCSLADRNALLLLASCEQTVSRLFDLILKVIFQLPLSLLA